MTCNYTLFKTKGQALPVPLDPNNPVSISGRQRFYLPAVAVSRCQPDSVLMRATCDELARLLNAS